jgi:hypothetical protein
MKWTARGILNKMNGMKQKEEKERTEKVNGHRNIQVFLVTF